MPTTTDSLAVIEPATEQPLEDLPRAGVEATDDAVARARAAYPSWRAVAPRDRPRQLDRLAAAPGRPAGELALLEARNAGNPVADPRGEPDRGGEAVRYHPRRPGRPGGDR